MLSHTCARPRRFVLISLLSLLLAMFVVAPVASAVTLDHSDRGTFQAIERNGVWKQPDGDHQARAIFSNESDRNYFTFDLTGISGIVTGATLEIFSPEGSYQSSAATETLGLFQVTTSAADLLAGDAGPAPETVFPDLGSGPSYGDLVFSEATTGSYVTAALNPTAIADIQGLLGLGSFTVGGALQSIDGSIGAGGFTEGVLRQTATGDPASRLVLTIVPEPSTALLLGLGLALVAGRRRNQA